MRRLPLFELGLTTATPNALDLLRKTGISPSTLLQRHATGDFGDLCEDDQKANQLALKNEARIFSCYILPPGNEKIWLITEADRRSTTLLLPEDY